MPLGCFAVADFLSSLVFLCVLGTGEGRDRDALAVVTSLGVVAAGLLGSFGIKERWISASATAESLKSEEFLYRIRATNTYDPASTEDEILKQFGTRIDNILKDEVAAWRVEALKTAQPVVSSKS